MWKRLAKLKSILDERSRLRTQIYVAQWWIYTFWFGWVRLLEVIR